MSIRYNPQNQIQYLGYTQLILLNFNNKDKMSGYTRKTIREISILFLMSILASLFAYSLRLLIARSLLPEEYGLVYAIMAFFGLSYILQTLGLNSALVKYIAEFRARSEFESIKNSILITSVIQFISTSILGVIFIVFSDLIAASYFHEPSASFLIKVYAIGIILSPVYNIVKAIFQGFQRMEYYSLVDFLKMLLVFVFTYILLEMRLSTLAPILAYTLVYIPPVILYPYILKKIFPEFIKIKARWDSKLAKILIAFGIPVMFTEISSTILGYTDTVMITLFRSMKEVGLYNIGMPTAGLLWKLTGVLGTVLLPLSSELWAVEKREQIKKGLIDLYKYSAILILPASLIMFMFPEIIIELLFGTEYIGASNVLRILSAGAIIFTLTSANNSILTGIGQPKEVSKILITGSLFNLLGNLIFIPLYGIGGAAATTLLSSIIMMLLSISKLSKFINLELPWVDFIKIAFAGIMFSIVVFSISAILPIDLLPGLIMSITIGLLVYTILMFYLRILTLDEVNKLLKRII